MRTMMRSIGSIRPYEQNPRINDQAVDAVAASIREFGFRQPIVVDGDGVIVVGHVRWKAAQRLGLEKVPVHVAKNLTAEQVKAYRLADNKTNELAEWNLALLAEEFKDLLEVDIDLALLGFSEEEVAGILEGIAPPDEFPVVDETICTEHTCPRCGYKWSGGT